VIRTFLGWDGPALPRAAGVLLDHYGEAGVARMDDAVVALPGGRAGRRLKEVLVEGAAARGARLVPPRVITVGALPELLYEPPRPLASDAVARLAWAAALRQLPAARLEGVFARRPEEETPAAWGGLAREVARLHREVARAGLRFDDVAVRCREAARAGDARWDDAARWEVLSEVQRRYEAQLAGAGLADRELARREALDEGRLGFTGELWLVGVSELPGVLRRAVEAVSGRARALIHAPEDRADAFDALGCVVTEAWEGATVPLDDATLVVRDRPGHQADEVARWLDGLGSRYAGDEVVVGVPAREVVPWVEERLEDAGVPVRDAAGAPLNRTGPFRAIAAVAEALDGHRWAPFAALARHPDVEAWLERSEEGESGRPARDGGRRAAAGGRLEALDRWYARHLPARLPPDLGSSRSRLPGADEGGRHGRAAKTTTAVVRRLHGGLLEPFVEPRRRPLRRWVHPVLTLLDELYGHRTLDTSKPADRRRARILQSLGQAVRDFEELPPALDEPCEAVAAVQLFLDHASAAHIPAEPERAAVELLGWLELHLDDAPAAVVTGVNEPWLPESATADPFLPDSVRARLGLVDNRARYARDAYRLTAMIHAREELRLVAGRRSARGDPYRPSRLLFAADGRTVARRVRRFYDDEYGRKEGPEGGRPGDAPTPASTPHPDATPSAFELPPEKTIRIESPPTTLRVTDFARLLADPYAFILERERGCEPLDDHAREMDALVFGTLAHRVLERFGRDPDGVGASDPVKAAGRLDALLDDAVTRRFGRGARLAHAAVRLQVEQLRARLRRFAQWHAGRVDEGWRVVHTELQTPEGGVPLDVDGTPVGITARIDRVERHEASGRWAVFDYKTGDKARDPAKTHGPKDEEGWLDLQLPLYAWLLPRIPGVDGRPLAPDARRSVQMGYVVLPRDLDATGERMAQWSAGELDDALETAREVIRRLRSDPVTFDEDRVSRWADPRMEALLGLGQLAARLPDEEGS